MSAKTGNSWRDSEFGRLAAALVRVTHYMLVMTVLGGWAFNHPLWLKAYALFIPLMVIQWRFNHDACILTNLEFWITHEEHVRPHPRDQDPFIGRMLAKLYGRPVSFATTQAWAHGIAMLVWLLGLGHLTLLGGW